MNKIKERFKMTRAEAINRLKQEGSLDEDIIIMWWSQDSINKNEWSNMVSELTLESLIRLLKKSGLLHLGTLAKVLNVKI